MTEIRYDHRYHAGNVGDVWKHVVLVALLDQLDRSRAHLFVDTHAGSGTYSLASSGEWSEGLGKLEAFEGPAPTPVRRYLEIVRAPFREGRQYLGSPAIARAVLGREHTIRAFEIDEDAHRALARSFHGDAKAEISADDGLIGLRNHIAETSLALVDPPFMDKREWKAVPDALISIAKAHPEKTIVFWYPIKSYARPNAMLARFEEEGVAGHAVELITSPLNSKRNRLNGSGTLILGASEGIIEMLASIATWLGPRLAISGGFYTTRCVGFDRRVLTKQRA